MSELEPMPLEPWLKPVEEPTAPEPVVEKKEKVKRGPRKKSVTTEAATAGKLVEFEPATMALIKQVAKAYGWSDSKVIKQAVKASLEPLVVNGKIDTDSPGVVAFWKRAIQ